MKTILVGNNGSFLVDAEKAFLAANVNLIVVGLNADVNGYSVIQELRSIQVENQVSQIIFMGGETRKVESMFFKNFFIPKLILNYAIGCRAHFIYLSSMSVFDGYLIDDHFDSPKTTYGYTKKLFDLYAKKHWSNLLTVYPASIISSRRLGSVQRYLDLIEKFSFSKRLSFPGRITYIDRESLILALVEFSKAREVGDVILMNEIALEDIRLELFPGHSLKVNIPRPVIKLLCKVIPSLAGKITALFFRNYTPDFKIVHGKSLDLSEIPRL